MKNQQLPPGDRPEAFDPNMTAERFNQKFTGDMGDLASITIGTTQLHGKLKEGFTPAEGYELNADGCVVPKGHP